MTLEKLFNAEDAVRSYRWLGHQGHGYTELLALHPLYKPGSKHVEENRANEAFPRIWYATNEKQLLAFLSSYHGSHLCAFGVNPRPGVLKGNKGFPRRAKDEDIQVVQSFYLDVDLLHPLQDVRQLENIDDFCAELDAGLRKEGLASPVRAPTGNGYHFLFALPAVHVRQYPDIGTRIRVFYRRLNQMFADDLDRAEVRMDNTSDLSRIAKVYGTRKPDSRKMSRFCATERVEDPVLLEYLLSLPLEEGTMDPVFGTKRILRIGEGLPKAFIHLVENDERISALWRGVRKEKGDTSTSGYDMSLMYACIRNGITDVRELATILALRREGAVLASGKGDDYIRRTIAKAVGGALW